MTVRNQRQFWILGMFLLGMALGGCSTQYYRKSADKEVAKTIAEKTPLVPNMDPQFTIESTDDISLEHLPLRTEREEFFGKEDEDYEVGARVLPLEEALRLAVQHSRTYQTEKELVFIQALNLTLARYRFTPIFSGALSLVYQGERAGTDLAIEHGVRGRAQVGPEMLLHSGGRIAASFSTDFFRFVTGDPRLLTSSSLGATFSQPLLRGAGFKVAMESLTQAERDLLYRLRTFAHHRKEFAVEIATAYYRTLQQRDTVRNTWLGLQNFRVNVERERAFADEGQRTQTALGQLRQAELSTETQWINAVRNYKQSLDEFKLQLGLPVDLHIVLDPVELSELEIEHPELTVDEAVRVALETRLDLYNQRDQYDDAARRIHVAASQLKPDLNLFASATVANPPDSSRLIALDFDRPQWSAGLDFDPGFDRKSQRNNYRSSLIQYERSGRELERAVDQIKLAMNEAWRALDQARRNYETAEIGVELSQRRVEEQELLTELGRGTARDLVEARTDLINAQNQLTSALVSHTVARLEFWRDMGILYIKTDGNWEEPNHVTTIEP